MGKTKTKTLTEKQKQREELNAVLSFTEGQLVRMQKQDWKDLNEDQVNILENFLATAITTMRICPPAYVAVASNTVKVRAKAAESLLKERSIPLELDNGTDEKGNVYYGAEITQSSEEEFNKATAEGRVRVIPEAP